MTGHNIRTHQVVMKQVIEDALPKFPTVLCDLIVDYKDQLEKFCTTEECDGVEERIKQRRKNKQRRKKKRQRIPLFLVLRFGRARATRLSANLKACEKLIRQMKNL